MPSLPTIDPVEMEQMLAGRIRDTLNNVPLIASSCKVYTEERFPDSDAEDIQVSTIPDFDVPEVPYTSIIEIGIPAVEEKVYTSEHNTQLTFDYPISFSAGYEDAWANGPYRTSRAFAMAVYMKARKEFKRDKTLAFDNCEHMYLQQVSAVTVQDEETGGRFHAIEWALRVHVKGVAA